MYRTTKLLLLFAFLIARVNCRFLREMTSYGNEQTFQGKRIIFGTGQIVTDSESYVYAVCDSQEFVFQENKCNVVIETPGFTNNAIYKDSCYVNIATSLKNHALTELKLYPFDDDKVLLSWQAKDPNDITHTINVRILYMSNCKYHEVALAANKLIGVVPYSSENNFDVILSGNKTCKSDACRITYDTTGKQVGRPKQFLPNIKFVKILNIEPIAASSPAKGFYALIKTTPHKLDEVQVLQVDFEGKGTEPNKDNSFVSSNFVISNAYEHFTTCWACDRTNITCRQYDPKLNLRLNVVLGFLDEPGFGTPRWMKIHNLLEGGFLLVTGTKDNSNERKFNNFSIVKVHQNGRRDRPLEIGLGFECMNIKSLLVNVSENDEKEVCVHFACDRIDFDSQGSRSVVKYNSKCIHNSLVQPAKYKASVLN